MKAITGIVSCMLIVLLLNCKRQEVSGVDPAFKLWWGGWALQQTGYLTPGGIVTSPAATTGAVQALTFTREGKFYVQGSELKEFADFNYYQVDSTQAGLQLRLSKTLTSQPDTARLIIENGKMTIYPRASRTYSYLLAQLYYTD